MPIANGVPIPRDVRDWASTETAEDILRSLELVFTEERPSITMIAGVPGSGKTRALQQFCGVLPGEAMYFRASCGEGTVWNMVEAMKRQFGVRFRFRSLPEAQDYLGHEVIGAGRMLMVDEAQYLNQYDPKKRVTGAALEWLRAASEAAGFHLAFCGDLDLPPAITAKPQLQSRLKRPVVIRAVAKGDVAALVAATAFDRPELVNALHAAARLDGGLRNVETLVHHARLLCGDSAPTAAHVAAAMKDLKLKTGDRS